MTQKPSQTPSPFSQSTPGEGNPVEAPPASPPPAVSSLPVQPSLRAVDAALRQEAARAMGQASSEAKRAAVRENGKRGGRPRGSQTTPEAKARMGAAQKQRRIQERAALQGQKSPQENEDQGPQSGPPPRPEE